MSDAGQTTGKLYVISGPSGSGKSTLCRMAVPQTAARLSVSATTRAKSDKEIDGTDYFFLSREAFEEKIRANEFLEYADVFDNYYGTPSQAVERMQAQGQSVILEIDVQGATQVFKNRPDTIGIFILPPSSDELKNRLQRRGRDDESAIHRRLKKAQWEIDEAKKDGHYKYYIVNDQLEEAVEELVQILGQDE